MTNNDTNITRSADTQGLSAQNAVDVQHPKTNNLNGRSCYKVEGLERVGKWFIAVIVTIATGIFVGVLLSEDLRNLWREVGTGKKIEYLKGLDAEAKKHSIPMDSTKNVKSTAVNVESLRKTRTVPISKPIEPKIEKLHKDSSKLTLSTGAAYIETNFLTPTQDIKARSPTMDEFRDKPSLPIMLDRNYDEVLKPEVEIKIKEEIRLDEKGKPIVVNVTVSKKPTEELIPVKVSADYLVARVNREGDSNFKIKQLKEALKKDFDESTALELADQRTPNRIELKKKNDLYPWESDQLYVKGLIKDKIGDKKMLLPAQKEQIKQEVLQEMYRQRQIDQQKKNVIGKIDELVNGLTKEDLKEISSRYPHIQPEDLKAFIKNIVISKLQGDEDIKTTWKDPLALKVADKILNNLETQMKPDEHAWLERMNLVNNESTVGPVISYAKLFQSGLNFPVAATGFANKLLSEWVSISPTNI